jgi:hypothetical protein
LLPWIMMRKFILLSLLAVLSVPAAPALAADGSTVIADCNNNGFLTGHYSRAQLQSALNGMGADVREYTNCYDVIRRALLATAASASKGGGGGTTAGGTLPGIAKDTAAKRHKGKPSNSPLTRGVWGNLPNGTPAGNGSHKAVLLDGSPISPGTAGLGSGSDTRSLPAPLLVVLVLLGLGAAGGGAVAVRRRGLRWRGGLPWRSH